MTEWVATINERCLHMGEEKCCPCESVKELQKKYEEIQERLYEGNTHFQKLDMQFTHIEEGIANIQADLKEIRYDAIFGNAINVILAILLTYLATMAGLQ